MSESIVVNLLNAFIGVFTAIPRLLIFWFGGLL